MTYPEIPDAQGCKERAIGTLRQFEKIDRNADGAIFALQLLGQVAQVWATLATVPEPLEEVHDQILDAVEPRFPIVRCAHGFPLAYEPQEDGTLQLQDGAYGCVGCT